MKYKIGKRTFFIECLTPIATILDIFNSNDSLSKDQISILTAMQGFVVDRILKQLCEIPQTQKNKQTTTKTTTKTKTKADNKNEKIEKKTIFSKKKEEKYPILKQNDGSYSLNFDFEKNKSSRIFYL